MPLTMGQIRAMAESHKPLHGRKATTAKKPKAPTKPSRGAKGGYTRLGTRIASGGSNPWGTRDLAR